MQKIIWKVGKLSIGVASVRIRAMAPAFLLRRRGRRVIVTDRRPSIDEVREADAVVIGKSFSADDVWLCNAAKRVGTPLIIDLCDDLGAARRRDELDCFLAQARQAVRIVTTGDPLREAIARYGVPDEKIEIIPDTAESKSLLQDLVREFEAAHMGQKARIFGAGPFRRWRDALTGRERPLLPDARLVAWFGNAGRPGDGVGLESLRVAAPALEALHATTPLQLLVITRGYSAFRRATHGFGIPCVYREWSLYGTMELLKQADVVILPNPANDVARVKSANRCMLALSCGVPVVASPIPALAEFADCIALDGWESGLRRYLSDDQRAWLDVAKGRKRIAETYSPERTVERWSALLDSVAASAGRDDIRADVADPSSTAAPAPIA